MKSIPKRTRVWEINKSRVEEKEEGEEMDISNVKFFRERDLANENNNKMTNKMTLEEWETLGIIKVEDLANSHDNFLRSCGFRPKRTEKYYKYLTKKLDKMGLDLIMQFSYFVTRENEVVCWYVYGFINKEKVRE